MRITALAAALLLAASPLAAFASDRQDADQAMTQAGTAIEGAEHGDAAQYAGADLGNAHRMLAAAQTDYDHRHWTDAIIGAENAKADADLATARSRQLRAEQATAEVERSMRSLRDQLGINAGDQP